MKTSLLAIIAVLSASPALATDLAFHISEDVVEDEVSPRHAHHVTHWEGDYYVADAGVTVSGWGRLPAPLKTNPYDTAIPGTNRWGTAGVTVFHRTDQGLDVTIEYDSFIVHRSVVMTGPQTCTETATATLKPGHSVYEVHRRSNLEPMFDVRRDFSNTRCRPPALSS